MPKKNSLLYKHNYMRLTNEECNRFFEMIKGTSLEDEQFLKRRSTPEHVYVYRKESELFRGEKYRDWRRITNIVSKNRYNNR